MSKEPSIVDKNSASRPRTARRFGFILGAIGLGLTICWGIPELVVRIINPQLESFTTILFDNDPNSPQLFMKDPRLHWKLRPNSVVQFVGTEVCTDMHGCRLAAMVKPSGRETILCLGDSTTFGWRVEQSQTFSAQLQRLLDQHESTRGRFHVINAGVPGYSSFQIRIQAEQLLRWLRPKAVVICIGNNDAWPVQVSDQQLDESRSVTSSLLQLLAHSRFLVWAAESIRQDAPETFIMPALDQAVERCSKDEFAANLTKLGKDARRIGAKVIFVSPTVTFEDRGHLWMIPIGDVQQFEQDLRRIGELHNQRQYDQAVETADLLLERYPNDFRYLWAKGQLLVGLGRHREGKALLEESLERCPFPNRCKLSYRQAVAQVAREIKAVHIDSNELLANYPPLEAYLDHCHPTPLGHSAIAQVIFDEIDDI